ncbi:MAG: adenosine deaminase [Anaerolineae bacterium]|nr:adenosine deaminase [Anaerolineae bacterium]
MVDLHAFVCQMPKVELHVHLEGAIRPATLLQLAKRNRFALPAQDVEGLRDFYRFRDFAHFIEVYVTITRCLQTQDDYHLIAYEFGADCARQNVRYAEVTFSIFTNVTYANLPWQAIVDGLNAGRAQARTELGVDWRWVFDIVRDAPQTQEQVVEIALAAHDQGVVALGLGGSEKGFPPELFVQSFERARQGGLHSVPHAGEIAGPESIWNALRLLYAERIGHGVRCEDDPALVDYLRERQIPLEMCPTSNICLGVFPSYEAHPLRWLWDEGLFITVNSDDPPLFNTDLNHEYEVLVDHFGFTADELEQVSLNALRASFLPQAEKAQLETEFRAGFARLRETR